MTCALCGQPLLIAARRISDLLNRIDLLSRIDLLALLPLTGCYSCTLREDPQRAANHRLDAFHDAAAHANFNAYFDCFTTDAVFLGTDATERWDPAAFRAYAHPHFAKGKAWSFRNVYRDDFQGKFLADYQDAAYARRYTELVANPGVAVSRERLLAASHSRAEGLLLRAVDVAVMRLRKRVEPDPAQPRYLQTIRGHGYMFVPAAPIDGAALPLQRSRRSTPSGVAASPSMNSV